MRLGIVADVHGDAEALGAALGHLRGLGANAVWSAGDVVGDAPGSDEAVARPRAQNVSTVIGNHERWVIEDFSDEGEGLSRDSRRWLRSLPCVHRAELAGVRVCMIHGDGRSVAEIAGVRFDSDPSDISADWPAGQLRALIEDSGADVLLVGHTHAFCLTLNGPRGDPAMVANPGACCRLGQAFAPKTPASPKAAC
jgi:predicted phosphodiesterase